MSDWTPAIFFVAPAASVALVIAAWSAGTYLEGRAIAAALNAAARLREAENVRLAQQAKGESEGGGDD